MQQVTSKLTDPTIAKHQTIENQKQKSNFLNDWAFTNIHQVWEMDLSSPTWIGRATHSRIDYIWVLSDIAFNNIHSFSNKKAEDVVNSDHILLYLKLFSNNLIKLPIIKPLRKKGKKNNNTVSKLNRKTME